MEHILPVVNIETLQQKANEYAQKGAEKTLEEFYTGYNSPYKKAIEENLKNKGVHNNFDIPDIVAVLNEKFSAEIDQIANTAVAKSFLPMVKKFLSREKAEINFSDILKEFISVSDYKYNDDLSVDDYTVEEITDNSRSYKSSFPEFKISNGELTYILKFFKNKELTTVMSLPCMIDESGRRTHNFSLNQKMKISLDNGNSLELPFTKGILEDDFIGYIARLVIGNNNITFDTEDFNEDMFPETEQSNCY